MRLLWMRGETRKVGRVTKDLELKHCIMLREAMSRERATQETFLNREFYS